MIKKEICNARAAIDYVEKSIVDKEHDNVKNLNRKDAAAVLNVTTETLRTWERNGLINVGRSENGYRVYNTENMARLNIIRTLRCANYSLSSIHRLLSHLDRNSDCKVEMVLDTPDTDEDIISVCDRLITSLQNTASDAEQIKGMLEDFKNNYSTLH